MKRPLNLAQQFVIIPKVKLLCLVKQDEVKLFRQLHLIRHEINFFLGNLNEALQYKLLVLYIKHIFAQIYE